MQWLPHTVFKPSVENETANELASDGVDVLKAWMKKAKTELEQSTEK